jgi:hypothetical protein
LQRQPPSPASSPPSGRSPELELELDVELEVDPVVSAAATNAQAASSSGVALMIVQGDLVRSAPLTKETLEHCEMFIAPVAAHALTARMAATQASVDAVEISAAAFANP